MGICDGRVVIVTGAGNGLGNAYALGLAAEGAEVVVNDLGVGTHGEAGDSRGAAEKVVDEIRAAGGQAVADTGDVADWDAGKRIVQTALDTFGGLHAVVNNAGFVRDRMFVSCTPEEWDAVLRVHLARPFLHQPPRGRLLARAAEGRPAGRCAHHQHDFRRRPAGLRRPKSAYSTAKGGIATLTLVQAAELGSLWHHRQRAGAQRAHPHDGNRRLRHGCRSRATSMCSRPKIRPRWSPGLASAESRRRHRPGIRTEGRQDFPVGRLDRQSRRRQGRPPGLPPNSVRWCGTC